MHMVYGELHIYPYQVLYQNANDNDCRPPLHHDVCKLDHLANPTDRKSVGSVELKDVKMYFNKNQFPTLPFCGPHSKPHGAGGISKHYHLRFDTKLGMGKCEICRIPCACVACT